MPGFVAGSLLRFVQVLRTFPFTEFLRKLRDQQQQQGRDVESRCTQTRPSAERSEAQPEKNRCQDVDPQDGSQKRQGIRLETMPQLVKAPAGVLWGGLGATCDGLSAPNPTGGDSPARALRNRWRRARWAAAPPVRWAAPWRPRWAWSSRKHRHCRRACPGRSGPG